MMLTESDRQAMMRDLDGAARGLWVEIRSELQRGGAELPIWVLVSSREAIRPAFEIIMAAIRPYRDTGSETDFSITFDEFRDGRLFHWNHVEPYEIRSGHLTFALGEEATERSTVDSIYETL